MQTQVIPYLREIQKGAEDLPHRQPKAAATHPYQGGELWEVSLLTFEPEFRDKWTDEQIAETRKELAEQGIDWYYLPYHKWPSAAATAWDILRGTIRVWRLNGKKKFDVLHGRVHIPTLMGALARKFSSHKPKLLFDIRGFFPEEYTDAGIWPENGLLYRSAKRVEKWLMKEADGFVVLTEKARDILFPESVETGKDKLGRPVEVIPCCVDFAGRFNIDQKQDREKYRNRLGVGNRPVYSHVGALGGLYLTEQIADFLLAAKEKNNTFALFLTQSDPQLIFPLLRERGFTENDYFVEKVDSREIPGYLAAADAGLSFVKAGYATQSRSPTKIPEYLACGLPIIANRGVGDVDKLIEENGIGVLLEDFSKESYIFALNRIDELGDISEKCRRTAEREFDLETVGGDRYRRAYKALIGLSV